MRGYVFPEGVIIVGRGMDQIFLKLLQISKDAGHGNWWGDTFAVGVDPE
jgi:hypothetical protein